MLPRTFGLRAAIVPLIGLAAALWLATAHRDRAIGAQNAARMLPRIPGARPLNIIFILTDDHRYDAMGFMGHPFVETPNLDALAQNGVHFRNAFVTTSLCSPSRASILTGLYAHRHRVVDNNHPVPSGMVFFPQYLQGAGYETAFIGKWHMGGERDDPQPGFDHWVSFRGQGTYLPNRNGLNVNGARVPQKGYITDELTDYALDWLKARPLDRPFMLYLSHKAVHSDFVPAERHAGRYRDKPFIPPKTMAAAANDEGKPMWVRNQRNSFHGIDFAYHGSLDIADYYRRYAETLLAVDESLARIIALLRERRLLDSTLIAYMGDNGFAFGEHGLIDKRTAYEESMRVPLIVQCPAPCKPGSRRDELVANVDVAPTLLEAAGLEPPRGIDGASVLPLARGATTTWRSGLLYEYYWERNFPQTPTLHAWRGARYKYIRSYGLWDSDELYDLETDPMETKNLIRVPEHELLLKDLNAQLWRALADSDGLLIPLSPDRGLQQSNLRRATGAKPADFPSYQLRAPGRGQ